MKKIIILTLVFFILALSSSAQTYTWTSASSTSFTDAANWSPSGGPPQAGNDVIFDGSSSVNCVLDDATGAVVVAGVTITSAYNGTVDASANDLALAANFVQGGGTFITPSGLFEIGGHITKTGGSFVHNNAGITLVYIPAGITTSISGAISFNTLQIDPAALGASERFVNFGTSTVNAAVLTGVRPFSYQGNLTVLGNLSIGGTNSSATSANNGTITFSGAGPISITGAGAAARNKLPNVEVNTTGTISATGHVNILGNWVGTQGTLTPGTSTQNFYGASASVSGTAAAFDNLAVQSGATVTLPAGVEVKVAGSITRTAGNLIFPSTTILGLNGSGAQSLSTPAYTLGALRIYGPSSGNRTVTMGTTVNITDFVEVLSNAILASGGNLRLTSDASGTARLAALGSGASVTGNVVVETFLPGGSTGWANLGVRGVTGQTVKSWDTYSASAGANGIPMTCNGCDYDENSLGSYFVSVQGYQESDGSYPELVAGDALTPGVGYWTYVGNGFSTTTGLTVINTGALVQGNNITTPVTTGGTGAGLNLVANPYPSPILWSSVLNNSGVNVADFNDVIYVWNADLIGGTGGFAEWSGGVANPSGSISDVIPGGQGFYVEYTAGAGFGVITFDEINKVSTSTSDPLLKPASSNTISLFRMKLKGTYDGDETVFRFDPASTNMYDKRMDAHKIFQSPGYLGYEGPYTKYTSISSKDAFNEDYSINAMAPLTQSLSVPVLVKVSTTGTYSMSVFDFQNFNENVCVGIKDKLTNTYHDLRTGEYVFTISDTTSTTRFELLLCKDESIVTTGVSELNTVSGDIVINQNQDGAYVKTAFAKNTKATISAFNLMGQKLIDDVHIEGTATTTYLNLNTHGQVVFVRVVSDKENISKKMVLH